MRTLILTGFLLISINTVVRASDCRDAYVAARHNIFHNQSDIDNFENTPGAATLGGIFALLGGMITFDNPGLASVSSTGVGVATTTGAYAIHATSNLSDWLLNDMDSVLAVIEESRVGVGYNIKKFASANKTTVTNVVAIVSKLDAGNQLCGNGMLVSKNGLNLVISEYLKMNSLNTGTLK